MRKGPNEYPEVKTRTTASLWVCTSNKGLAPSTFSSCEWNFEMLLCLSGTKGLKTHLRSHEISKWALREEQGWLQSWILPFSPAACPSFLSDETTAVDRDVPAPGSPILLQCFLVSTSSDALRCSGAWGLRNKGRRISYIQQKSTTATSPTVWLLKSLF